MITQNIKFTISYCISKDRKLQGKSDCFPKEKIDEYIKNLEVEFWKCEERVNFQHYWPERPTHHLCGI